jgi:hypothetical protein
VPKAVFFAFALSLLPLAAQARAERSHAARLAFQREHPCPSTLDGPEGGRRGPCPGHVVDHIVPLSCGGADDPANMQWQTRADAKAKDRWERQCRQKYFRPPACIYNIVIL